MERYYEIIGIIAPSVVALAAVVSSVWISLSKNKETRRIEAKAEARDEELRREAKEEILRREARDEELRREVREEAKAESLRIEAKEIALRREVEAKEETLRREVDAKEEALRRKEFLIRMILDKSLSKAQRKPFMDEYLSAGNNGTITIFWDADE